jgi:hypothetical protein
MLGLVRPVESHEDVRASGDKHIRFNLNGGDSLAYWIDLQQPDIIGNFKGEPFLLTKTVDEGFYKSLVKASKATSSTVALPDGTEILAFYATNRNSALYVGVYDRAKDKLRVDKSTESAAYAWLKQNGVPITPSFPHYDLVHDISSNIRYEEGYPVINMYERTDLLKQFGGSERLTQLPLTMGLLDQHCPVIMTFLRSATGDKRSAEALSVSLICRASSGLVKLTQTRKSLRCSALCGRSSRMKTCALSLVVRGR